MAVMLDHLPGDLWQAILFFLRPKEFYALRLVSKRLAKVLGERMNIYKEMFASYLALNRRDKNGTYPLLILLEKKSHTYQEVVEMLDRGARANVRDDRYGKGALSLVSWNPKEIILLVQHGADPLATLHAGSPHFKEALSHFAWGRVTWSPESAAAIESMSYACFPLRNPRLSMPEALKRVTVSLQLLMHSNNHPKDVAAITAALHTALSCLSHRLSASELSTLGNQLLTSPFYETAHAAGVFLALQCRPSRSVVAETCKQVAEMMKRVETYRRLGSVYFQDAADWFARHSPHTRESIRLWKEYLDRSEPSEVYSNDFLAWLQAEGVDQVQAYRRLAPTPTRATVAPEPFPNQPKAAEKKEKKEKRSKKDKHKHKHKHKDSK